ncbi:IclR family transcriptional regulator [Mycolicibacterium baixiangningiae]|uniref:IclR family transcriptional regulator n=1 Tax=Mycolicibacterium baixiangningiae TaxID=2761578 RepID=UPI001868FB79|nr:IclR family transcriptional regulator [Mycolicibacterium baixiangningiae]
MQKARPESETGPAYPIASVNNALLLLLLFRDQQRVRLTEACKYLGVAHSTAHRLLAMLAHHGFVQQDPVTRAYVAGPALVEVGLAVVGSLDIREQARPVMENLNAALGETVHLGVLEGVNVRYVDAVESERALRVVARTGTLVPAHCTSLGKALLSQMTDREVADLYPTSAEPFASRTDRSITTQAALMKEIVKARNRGYAVNSGETEDDVGSIAVAFRDLAGRMAAIAVAAPSSRLSRQRIARIGELLIETIAKAPDSPRRI